MVNSIDVGYSTVSQHPAGGMLWHTVSAFVDKRLTVVSYWMISKRPDMLNTWFYFPHVLSMNGIDETRQQSSLWQLSSAWSSSSITYCAFLSGICAVLSDILTEWLIRLQIKPGAVASWTTAQDRNDEYLGARWPHKVNDFCLTRWRGCAVRTGTSQWWVFINSYTR